ncbi:hypothetical protein L218DRAFT_877048 [Marasmius fiardii PR-910]|nr:hypothetical protein L218DRAFT_877048 [Marasmius fiardii PR-910]
MNTSIAPPLSSVCQGPIQAITALYHSIGIICQTFFFGIYACLAVFSIYLMAKTGLKNGARRYLLIMSIFMFFISTAYWITKILGVVSQMQKIINNEPPFETLASAPLVNLDVILSSVVLINYVLTDAAVLWRAWVLCSDDYRKQLYVPLIFQFCVMSTVSGTIIVRIIIQSIPHIDGDASIPRVKSLQRTINIFQVANLGFSLLLNLSATGLITLKAWRFRRWIKFDLEAIHSQRTRGEKIMALLIESGFLYCISVTTNLVFTLIRLRVGTLGDIYTPVNIQVAGIYPLVVLLLVNHGKSLEQTILGRKTTNNGHALPPLATQSLNNPGVLESIRFHSIHLTSNSLAAENQMHRHV